MRSVRLLLAPLALVSPFAAGCGHDAPSVPKSAVAVVGEQTITRAQYDALMTQARQSYAARKEPFPQAGTTAYANLKASAVRLLVEQAELEQKAPDLGVTIDEGQVEAGRRLLIDETFGGSEARYRARLREERMTDAQIRSALRAQLLSQAVSEAVTAGVTVSAQAVQSYYESHLSSYTRPGTHVITPLADVRDSIRRQLLGQARKQRYASWLAATKAEFARKTAYAEGFAPSNGG